MVNQVSLDTNQAVKEVGLALGQIVSKFNMSALQSSAVFVVQWGSKL